MPPGAQYRELQFIVDANNASVADTRFENCLFFKNLLVICAVLTRTGYQHNVNVLSSIAGISVVPFGMKCKQPQSCRSYSYIGHMYSCYVEM